MCSLDRIALVTHGKEQALEGLRGGVAPLSEWIVRQFAEWPDISIDGYQKRGIEGREEDGTGQEIRMFCLWPAIRRCIGEREER